MFLFTTPTSTAPASPPTASESPVVGAIRDGAARTGTGFDYLLATAQRESGLDPAAKNGASSATGLFQFIEQTWLGVMKSDGPRLGLARAAEQIRSGADGRYTVADADARQAILDLRRDPEVAATMAGALTQHNREALGQSLGREPTAGDLYAAHVLGARGAADLIRTAQASPARPPATDMPEAAAANRTIFYDRSGRAKGAAEVYATLAAGRTGTAASTPARAAVTLTGSDGTTAVLPTEGPMLQSLFQTDVRRGPVSGGVARLWQTPAASSAAAPAFFPRGDGSEDSPARQETTGSLATAAASAGAAPVAAPALDPATVPLPPRRPAELSGATAARATPFDLSAFTKARP